MGEREIRTALAKLDSATELNTALEQRLAAAYADLKTMELTLDELRASLVQLEALPP